MGKQHTVFLSTGSNRGNRLRQLAIARQWIEERIGAIEAASHVYQTQAWGMEEQGDFLNQVLKVRTTLSPESVLENIQGIEKKMGRVREEKWGSRLIDIDILFYDNRIIHTSTLIVPHPLIPNRRFVLAPLQEIAPDFRHPLLQKTISELLTETPDSLEVHYFEDD